MLAAGEIDALYAPRKPSCYGNGTVRRLWEDYVPVERAYFERTRIFPIMHVAVIRRDVLRTRPLGRHGAVQGVQGGANDRVPRPVSQRGAQDDGPVVGRRRGATSALMGDDFWPYGFAANERVLDVFTRYFHEQGLSLHKREPRELFAPETLEAFTI